MYVSSIIVGNRGLVLFLFCLVERQVHSFSPVPPSSLKLENAILNIRQTTNSGTVQIAPRRSNLVLKSSSVEPETKEESSLQQKNETNQHESGEEILMGKMSSVENMTPVSSDRSNVDDNEILSVDTEVNNDENGAKNLDSSLSLNSKSTSDEVGMDKFENDKIDEMISSASFSLKKSALFYSDPELTTSEEDEKLDTSMSPKVKHIVLDQDVSNKTQQQEVEMKSQNENDSSSEATIPVKTKKKSSEPWRVAPSLGSFLLRRREIEEGEIEKMVELTSDGKGGQMDNSDPAVEGKSVEDDVKITTKDPLEGPEIMDVQKELDVRLQKFASDAETTIASMETTIASIASEAETTLSSFMDGGSATKDKVSLERKENDDLQQKQEQPSDTEKERSKRKNDFRGMDLELIKEVDESVIPLRSRINEIMDEIEVLQTLPSSSTPTGMIDAAPSLPLGDKQHISRIDVDMDRLAVSIASTIVTEEDWRTFCKDGGGVLPLLNCIRAGAREIRQGSIGQQMSGNYLVYDEGVHGLVERQEAAFEAASAACKALRDLCVISKPLSAIVTDSILRADAVWAEPTKRKEGYWFGSIQKDHESKMVLTNGLISDLVTLLRYSSETDKLYKGPNAKDIKRLRRRGLKVLQRRRQRRGKFSIIGLSDTTCFFRHHTHHHCLYSLQRGENVVDYTWFSCSLPCLLQAIEQ